MKKAAMVTRILFGLLFLVFGLNGFFQFIPLPAPSAEGGAFLGALAKTGYMFPLIKVVEIASGLALVANFFVPFALVLIAPIVVNIVFYHACLDPAGMALPLVLLVLHVFTSYSYRAYFKELFSVKSEL